MRFQVVTLLTAAMFLAACVSASNEGVSSSAADSVAGADGGAVAADAGPASSDGGIVSVDGGLVDASVPSAPTYAQEAPVINANCGGCHGTKFNTLAKVRAHRSDMIDLLQQGAMPKDNPSFNDTPEGAALLDFLENDPELN